MRLMALFTLFLSSLVVASTEVVEFSDESLRPRFQQLVEELRCPKCQNQNLADSNSPISQDLRREIQRMLEQQMTDQQIKDYLKSRYSEFILYRPEVNKSTWLLWGSPAVILLLGLLIAMRHNRQKPLATESNSASAADQQRLAALLDDEANQQ
jgi:cytochrome c-type biogenesis protein CcmH